SITSMNESNSKSSLPTQYGFLIVPGFSLIAYAAAIDTLRLANRVAGDTLYTWETISVDGEVVIASSGLEVAPARAAKNLVANYAALFVCGGIKVNLAWSRPMSECLRSLSKKKVALGSLCNGSYLLAKSGVLDGYRCTIHWERLASMREEFPKLQLTDDIYEIDRDRYTCAGGTTPIDMMLELISKQHGRSLSAAISEVILVDRVRSMQDHQRIPLRQKLGTSQPKLTEAVMLMEANLEEPLSPDELANYVNISRRQLERLFRSYLDCTPTQYYLGLRLRNARLLLLQTEKSIVEISLACGFASAPHFSKCYRDRFGLPPRDERRLLLAQGSDKSLDHASVLGDQ
ncbi:MAG: GlxA family transcriptional regulator, partial [Methylococcales bacterium]|nr:GlxA family transcriptional regulator [Methylococcales bacterium]